MGKAPDLEKEYINLDLEKKLYQAAQAAQKPDPQSKSITFRSTTVPTEIPTECRDFNVDTTAQIYHGQVIAVWAASSRGFVLC